MSLAPFEELWALCQKAPAPGLVPEQRPGVLPAAAVREQVEQCLSSLAIPRRELIVGTALLWHDHLDPAHEIAQNDHSADGSLLHAILHRREPDYSNAKYWFRRAGAHPSFIPLAHRAAPLLDEHPDAVPNTSLTESGWDPFAFVDACESAARAPANSPQRRLLVDIQSIEFEMLLRHLVA